MGLAKAKSGAELLDEESIDSQFLFLLIGIVLGAGLLSVCWILSLSNVKEFMDTLNVRPQNSTAVEILDSLTLGTHIAVTKWPSLAPFMGSVSTVLAFGFALAFGLP